MLTLIFRSDSSFPESSIFIHCPLPIAITKMDESHFSPLGLIKIVRAERSRGRGRRSRGKKQRARARETARLYEGMVERRGRKNRAEARERERDMGSIIERKRDVECNVPAYDLSANFSGRPLIDCKHFASTPPLWLTHALLSRLFMGFARN